MVFHQTTLQSIWSPSVAAGEHFKVQDCSGICHIFSRDFSPTIQCRVMYRLILLYDYSTRENTLSVLNKTPGNGQLSFWLVLSLPPQPCPEECVPHWSAPVSLFGLWGLQRFSPGSHWALSAAPSKDCHWQTHPAAKAAWGRSAQLGHPASTWSLLQLPNSEGCRCFSLKHESKHPHNTFYSLSCSQICSLRIQS